MSEPLELQLARCRQQVEHLEARLTGLLESITDGFMMIDREWRFSYVNQAAERIVRRTRDDIVGQVLWKVFPEVTGTLFEREYRRAMTDSVSVTFEEYYPELDLWLEVHAYPSEEGLAVYFQDIGRRKRVEERLAYHADHDALTGLANRSMLERRLQQSCLPSQGHARRIALLYIDLDDFQSINDSLGHELGDRVLVEVAARVQQQVRRSDTVARLGGDAFVVLLPEPDDETVVVERLLAAIARPYRLDEHELHLTASIGIAVHEGGSPSTQLIQQADLAMYQAKRRGRNTYDWFSCELNTRVSQRVTLRSALQRAIDEQQFELHYQPQVHGASGRIVGCEALLRWRHPERGFIPPAEFIGLAEDTGQIIAINDWVVRTACRDNRRLNDLGLGEYPMAVNISPMQFHRSGFVERIQEMLDEAGLPPALLELELTENIMLESADQAIETLHALRRLGVGVVIDDFGTGFSSLSYLKHLPIDKIKIDRSFISEVTSDHRDAAIVQGIITMANSLQLKVIAEGVETQAHYAYLSKHLCDLFQGFYFAYPMPFEELLPFLQDHHAAANDLRPEDHGVVAPTILLLDDEANILSALNRTLRRDGYRILTATSARDAFDLLATQEVALVISDQRMPEMSGTEFLKRVKALYPQILQIILSGYTDLKTVTEAINEGGIYKFLTKPWDDDELRLVVQQAIRDAALQDARNRRQGQDGHTGSDT
ncbi:EAL domain-containing protein [Halomonas sp. LR3S48]|uniref:EAL domain-containing protein n=1 Tax=Halomonas sp. LR3S48 TaxID=2982694 RepID=UPI0021E4A85A|nr:EAL domain-containing protein [Halomonas sp. LR3S48]UYG04968.1 EAL domain-containing protein [Halomonas sp. LR3S48]